MRILNRPMFRYGGPIKEGVMNGIREPKRNGGSMRAALVGNPMFPVGPDGRAQHNKALQYIGSKVPFLAKTYNRGLANLKKIPGYLQSKMGKNVTTGSGTTTVGGKVVQTAGSGTKYVPSYLGRDPLVKLVGGTYRLATDPRAKGVGKKVVDAATSPTGILTIGSFTDALPGGNPLFGTRNVLGQKFDKETGIKTEGLFGRDLPAKAELEKIEADRIAKAEADEQARLKALYEVQNPEIREPKKSEEEIRKERIQKYRDIMDIKGMNKSAAYDSLIAASQAVLGAEDLKGSLKDGSLINKIIGSTSKAFDKPSKTKDAIDTLILKSEIEKDLNKDKNAIMDEYRMKQIALADKQLSGGGFSENKGVLAKTMSGQTLFDTAAAKSSPNFMGNLMTKKDLTNLMTEAKKKGDIVERDIIITTTEELIKGKGVPNGDYTVGDVLVTIVDSKVANVTR